MCVSTISRMGVKGVWCNSVKKGALSQHSLWGSGEGEGGGGGGGSPERRTLKTHGS